MQVVSQGGILWQPSKGEALTSQAPRRRLAESGRVPGSPDAPGAGVSEAALINSSSRAPGFLTLQQERRGCHVRQRRISPEFAAGHCWGKGLG